MRCMGAQCSNCQNDIEEDEAVFVEETGYAARTRVGQFCDYTCLKEYIDEEGYRRVTTPDTSR